jgi:hypothetical protein
MRIVTMGTTGLILSAVLFAAGPAAADPPLGVVVSMGFPTPVQMFAGGDPEPNRTQDVGAEYELTNLTNGTVTLKAIGDCDAHTWTVTDATGTVVDHSAVCPPSAQPVTLDVPQGKPADGQSTVSLHVFSYKEAQTYTIHYLVFGLEAKADFTVTLLK